jgi:hypothetical protein
MRERAAKFNVDKIKPQDLAGAGGHPASFLNHSDCFSDRFSWRIQSAFG